MSRDNPWFDPNDTVTHEFTPENCSIPALYGHWIELYAELAEQRLDALDTAPLTGVRESDQIGADGKRKNEYMVQARGLSIEQVAAWIKAWSGLGRQNIKPTAAHLGGLKRSSFNHIKAVVEAHAKAAMAASEPVLDPTQASPEIDTDSWSTFGADGSTSSSPEPLAPAPPDWADPTSA